MVKGKSYGTILGLTPVVGKNGRRGWGFKLSTGATSKGIITPFSSKTALESARKLIGRELIIDSAKKLHFLNLNRKVSEDSQIGKIRTGRTHLCEIEIFKHFEDLVRELDFVKFHHDFQSIASDGKVIGDRRMIIGQITELQRTIKGEFGTMKVLGDLGRIPPEEGERFRRATEKEIYDVLKFKETGYYLGKLYPSNVEVRLPTSYGEYNPFAKSMMVYGNIGQGKSTLLRVIAEERAEHRDAAVLIIDLLGDYCFKFAATDEFLPRKTEDDKADIKRYWDNRTFFGVHPKAYRDSLFLTFNKKADPFADVELDASPLQSRVVDGEETLADASYLGDPEFYKSILKNGLITTISLNTLEHKQQLIALKHISSALKKCGAEGILPQSMLLFDETQDLVKEGMKFAEGREELISLAKTQGHYLISLVAAQQRRAETKKSITNITSSIAVFQTPDVDVLDYTMKAYKRMIQNLPNGVCVIRGLTDTVFPLQVRPSHTLHLRTSQMKRQLAEENPALCEISEEWRNKLGRNAVV